MLINPANISPVLLVLGFLLAIGGGFWWVKTSYNFAKILKQPKPKIRFSVAKVLTCVLSFIFIYLAATHQWF